MPADPKIYFPGKLHFITTSVEADIMFPPNALIREIIYKCIAQAMALHPVKLHHIFCSGTHVHLLLTVIDPSDTAKFMERFKCESAHALNRLLGRTKRTIWCSGYDSPLIDTLESAEHWIAYLYENAAKDTLSQSIETYAGFTSFEQLKKATAKPRYRKGRYATYYLPRSAFTKLPEGTVLSEHDYRQIRKKIIRKRKRNYFEIDCNGWMNTLGIKDVKEQQEINQGLLREIASREARHAREREQAGKTVISRQELVSTPIGKPYQPERSGKRMLTLCVDVEHRKQTIAWMKELIAEGKRVLARWRLGDMSERYPMGLFPPTNIRLVEAVPE